MIIGLKSKESFVIFLFILIVFLSPVMLSQSIESQASWNLDSGFKQRLQEFVRASDGRLTLVSGYRSNEHQQRLYDDAVAKHGAENASRFVARPGASNHNHGLAGDLHFVNDEAKDWAHANAGKFGLEFPLSWEPWHIEPAGLRKGTYDKSSFAYDDTSIASDNTDTGRLRAQEGIDGDGLTIDCEFLGCGIPEIFQLANKVINFIIWIAIMAFSLVIIYAGGILALNSLIETPAAALSKAKGKIKKSLIGLLIALSAYLIVGFLFEIVGYKEDPFSSSGFGYTTTPSSSGRSGATRSGDADENSSLEQFTEEEIRDRRLLTEKEIRDRLRREEIDKAARSGDADEGSSLEQFTEEEIRDRRLLTEKEIRDRLRREEIDKAARSGDAGEGSSLEQFTEEEIRDRRLLTEKEIRDRLRRQEDEDSSSGQFTEEEIRDRGLLREKEIRDKLRRQEIDNRARSGNSTDWTQVDDTGSSTAKRTAEGDAYWDAIDEREWKKDQQFIRRFDIDQLNNPSSNVTYTYGGVSGREGKQLFIYSVTEYGGLEIDENGVWGYRDLNRNNFETQDSYNKAYYEVFGRYPRRKSIKK